MVVPQGVYGNPRQAIEIDLAVGVGQPTASAMAEGNRQAGIGIHQMRHGSPIAEALKLKRRLAPPDNETRTRTPDRYALTPSRSFAGQEITR
jgi:hypothetical protein